MKQNLLCSSFLFHGIYACNQSFTMSDIVKWTQINEIKYFIQQSMFRGIALQSDTAVDVIQFQKV
jgi:hypothetical protein